MDVALVLVLVDGVVVASSYSSGLLFLWEAKPDDDDDDETMVDDRWRWKLLLLGLEVAVGRTTTSCRR